MPGGLWGEGGQLPSAPFVRCPQGQRVAQAFRRGLTGPEPQLAFWTQGDCVLSWGCASYSRLITVSSRPRVHPEEEKCVHVCASV